MMILFAFSFTTTSCDKPEDVSQEIDAGCKDKDPWGGCNDTPPDDRE